MLSSMRRTTWGALVGIFTIQIGTLLVLAFTSRSAKRLRVGTSLLVACVTAYLHIVFPYTGSGLNRSIVPTAWGVLLHFIDILIVTNVDYESEMQWKIKTGMTSSISDGSWDRICWAFALMWNGRWIGTRLEVSRSRRVAAEKEKERQSATGLNRDQGQKKKQLSRREYVTRRFVLAIAIYLAMDLISCSPMPREVEERFFSAKNQYVFRRLHEITIEELGFRIGGTLGYCVASVSMIAFIHSLASAIIVGLHMGRPEDSPLPFGNPLNAWSVRRFWSLTWHQFLRRPLVSISNFIVHDILQVSEQSKDLADYLRVGFAFALSGLLHVLTDSSMGVPNHESGAISFFMMQPLGIAAEEMVMAMYYRFGGAPRTRLTRALGYVWTATFLIWTVPVFIYPLMRAVTRESIATLPISVINLLIRRANGVLQAWYGY